MTYRLIHSSNSTLNIGRECKSLVVYLSPTSILTTLKYKGFTSKLRGMCQIPVHLHTIILGLLLSDGCKYKNKSLKTLFCLKQTNFQYLWLVYSKLSHYSRSLPIITKTSLNGKNFTCVMFATRVSNCFTE